MLIRALQTTTLIQVAHRLGVSFSGVSAWARGASLPCPHARLALARELGIPADAWDQAAVEIPQARSSSSGSRR